MNLGFEMKRCSGRLNMSILGWLVSLGGLSFPWSLNKNVLSIGRYLISAADGSRSNQRFRKGRSFYVHLS